MTIAAPLLVGEVGEQLVDLALGADIDAARRLVDQEDAAARVEAARDHAFLLVAAGQLGDARAGAGRADVEAADELRRPRSRSLRALSSRAGAAARQAARW